MTPLLCRGTRNKETSCSQKKERHYAFEFRKHRNRGSALMGEVWFVIIVFPILAICIAAGVRHIAKLQVNRFNEPTEAEQRAAFDDRINNRGLINRSAHYDRYGRRID